jgi:hypothetical protein
MLFPWVSSATHCLDTAALTTCTRVELVTVLPETRQGLPVWRLVQASTEAPPMGHEHIPHAEGD